LYPRLHVLGQPLVDAEQFIELDDEIGEAPGVMVKNGNVAVGLVTTRSP
jgi:hypothetical protein